jgi:CDP-glucose 4,6-dehydratase
MGDGPRALEDMVTALDASFWRGRRVLLTGDTGFKGGWMAIQLKRLGAEVTGFALAPATTPDLFTLARIADDIAHHGCDLRDRLGVARIVHAARPEIVLHLAAQPLVRASYADPVGTFASNVMGTAHLLEACRESEGLKVVVVITTDKVYRNLDHPYPYREEDPLGGHDPYSASKAATEIVTASYRDSYLAAGGIAVATARAGNVIGGGDWSEDRLLPDAVRSWQTGGTLDVRRPDAVRPWQHVLEAVHAYLRLAEALWARPALAGAYNFGPETGDAATVRTVVDLARSAYGLGEVRFGEAEQGPHEAGWLSLEIAKARATLGIVPRWTLDEAVRRTMSWYRDLHAGADARALCVADIAAFEAAG